MSRPVTVTECPEPESLGRYVSGELSERDAAMLDKHVDRCASCQQKLDEISATPDSIIDAVRRSEPTTVRNAEALIARVAKQKLDAPKRAEASTTRTSDTVSIAEFERCFRKSRLLKKSEIDQLLDSISAKDTESLAAELIARDKLTEFQAFALKRGRYRGLTLGNYVVLDKLGSGGMGNVFKARHVRMGRLVCIKVLRSSRKKSAEVVSRFRREAKTIAALNHPNFVVAHDADESNGIPYLVMEYIAGQDLAKHVEQFGPIHPKKAIDILLDVSLALAHAHAVGIVHRDIKPHNLLLGLPAQPADIGETEITGSDLVDKGFIKILDLGLARFDSYIEVDSDSGIGPDADSDSTLRRSLTASGIVMGTVDYISPEQALNSRHADERSDVYSLGCTLFFLLTGRKVFAGETIMEKLLAHREDPIPNLQRKVPGVSRAMNAVFQKMLAKNPGERYQDMNELATDLRAIQRGGRPAAMKQRGIHRILSFKIVRVFLIMIAALLAFGGTGVASWYMVKVMSAPTIEEVDDVNGRKLNANTNE